MYLKLKNNKKLILTLVLLMLFTVVAPVLPVQAAGPAKHLTFDSDFFTIIDSIGNSQEIQLKALDSEYKPTDLSETDKKHVQWTLIGLDDEFDINNPGQIVYDNNVAKLEPVKDEKGIIVPDKIKINFKGEGETKLVAWVPTNKDLGYIHSNIFVEKVKTPVTVSNITVTIKDGSTTTSCDLDELTATSLEETPKALQYTPTALHALLATDNTVKVDKNSGYVEAINGKEASGMSGWVYKVNDKSFSYGPGVATLESGDEVTWEYVTFEW